MFISYMSDCDGVPVCDENHETLEEAIRAATPNLDTAVIFRDGGGYEIGAFVSSPNEDVAEQRLILRDDITIHSADPEA